MILVIPPNLLTKSEKIGIKKKGYIIIETEEPEKIKVLNPETIIEPNDWLMAALRALNVANPLDKCERFVNELYERLKKNEKR